MASESKVIVRLKLLGAALMGRDADRAASGLRNVQKGADGAQRSFRRVNGGKVQAEMSRVQRGTAIARRGLVGVQRATTAVSSAFARVAVPAALAAGLAFGGMATSAVSFEQQMARVRAVADATPGQFRAMSNEALQLGAKTQFSAGQAADGMYQLATAGFSARQVMRSMPGTLSLAAASGVELADAAELQASTIRAFGFQAGAATRVADALAYTVNRSAVEMSDLGDSLKYVAPVARASGQSMEDMLGAIGLLGNVGIKGEQAGTTLRTALIRLQAPTRMVREGLDALHVTAKDLYGPKGLRPLPQIIGKMAAGSRGLAKHTRNAALAHIFGREALSGMVNLVEKGQGSIDSFSRGVQRSAGYSKRAAGIMRNTVAGAWDNFTGSVETAAITLSQRFMPAIRGALNHAAGGVNGLAATGGNLLAGLVGEQPKTIQAAGPARPLPHGVAGPAKPVTTTESISTAQRVGLKIRAIALSIGHAAAGVGKQLVDALKPAMPFLQNVLLPLLIGVGKGLLGSVVTAFKVVIPVVKIAATALGAIGTAAKPLRGLFEGIGVVFGFVFSGPILKGVAAVGKTFEGAGLIIGTVGRGISLTARAALLPIRLLGAGMRVVGRAVGLVGSAFARGWTFVRRYVGFLGGLPGRIGRIGVNMVGSFVNGIAGLPGAARRVVGSVIGTVGRLGGRLLALGGRAGRAVATGLRGAADAAARAAGTVGRAIVRGIVNIIKNAPGEISAAVMSVVPGPVKGAVRKALGLADKVNPFAAGGVVRHRGVQLVGEQGPELVRFPVGTRITPADETRRLMQRPALMPARQPKVMLPPIVRPLEVHVHSILDGREVGRSVERIERALEEAR